MKIAIDVLLPLLKNGYVAMNKDGAWCYYQEKPILVADNEYWISKKFGQWDWLFGMFDIAPFDGDWRDSVMECGHTATVKDGE